MAESATFKNYAWTVAADLRLPPDFSPERQYAAIVCVPPAGGVKEQTAGLYAEKLADQGFVTLAYDATFQGDSAGEPRHLENPHLRVEDVSAAIDYLATLGYVDRERIGVLGVCAGGGYATHAAVIDTRIKVLGTVSAVSYGQMYRHGWDNAAKPQDSMGSPRPPSHCSPSISISWGNPRAFVRSRCIRARSTRPCNATWTWRK